MLIHNSTIHALKLEFKHPMPCCRLSLAESFSKSILDFWKFTRGACEPQAEQLSKNP